MNKINVIILGDANAGIITANKLRMRTGNDVEITIANEILKKNYMRRKR